MAKKSKNKKQAKVNTSNKMSIEKQNEIVSETQKLINELKNSKKNIFKRKEKELANRQAEDLQNLLNKNQYYVLQEKLNSLKKIEEQEKIQLEKEKNSSKEKKPKKTYKDRIKSIKEFDRWPLYSRTKRILEQEEGSVKVQKLCFMYIAFALLLGVAIVGLLMLVGVIPYSNDTSSGNANDYIPALVFAIPLALIFAL